MPFDPPFDPTSYRYPSRRNVVFGSRGMVVTSTPAAAQAGLEILQKGGNAIDAAIAAATCLTVVECGSNGIGGDSFALVWSGGKLHGLNASGPAPKNISAQLLLEKGFKTMPGSGFEAVTVPGAPSAWAALSKRFGRLPLTTVMEPAIRCAREGYPVSVNNAEQWMRKFPEYKANWTGDEYRYWFETFAPEGKPLAPGEIWRCEAMARTLEEIAATNSESFYRGDIMEKIVAFSRKYNGYFTPEDFTEFRPEWVDPIDVNYRGYTVHEIPPNGHGISALMALNILKGFDLPANRETAEAYHLQLEAMKFAYVDAKNYVTDPAHMKVTVSDLLSETYAEERRRLIRDHASIPTIGRPQSGGTVYLCAADNEGNMISMIQSNYNAWGSGLVVPDTGIALHNRGNNFTLDLNHDNVLAGGKRPYHTIIPGFLSKDGKPIGPFGVMGAFMQPQGHVQVMTNTIDWHMNPQEALDAPRWQWIRDLEVHLEPSVPAHVVQGLIDRGHKIIISHDEPSFGRGEIIRRMDNGVYVAGAEPRGDGHVAAW